MPRKNNSWLKKTAVIILFVILQGVAIFLMARHSVTQQAGIVHSLNAGHYFLWQRQQKVGRYFALTTINRELAEENTRLQNELYTYQTHKYPSAPNNAIFSAMGAEVVQNTTSSLQNYLIINKGSDDGIEQEMGVIGDMGVVGIVRDVSKHYARVISLLNTRIQINARIEPEGATGTLAWDGKSIHSAIISDMPQHSMVAVGDTAWTSGFSQIFPARIPLGIVTGTNISQGTFLEAKIKLFLNFNTLRYVYVIRNLHAQEIKALIQEP